MRYLLAALNAKYIHSNLGIYSLKAYAQKRHPSVEILLGEYTINHQPGDILADIYRKKPFLRLLLLYMERGNRAAAGAGCEKDPAGHGGLAGRPGGLL